MSNTENKIEASDKSISDFTKRSKSFISTTFKESTDGKKNIWKLLIEDLTTTFLKSYQNQLTKEHQMC